MKQQITSKQKRYDDRRDNTDVGKVLQCRDHATGRKTAQRLPPGHDVPEALQADKALFCQLSTTRTRRTTSMEARLSHAINTWNTVEKSSLRRARTASLRWLAGMAPACCCSSRSGSTQQPTSQRPAYASGNVETYDNPKDAMGETERVLTRFSLAINKGLGKINNEETKN
jgi:hypothetical protein